MADVVFAMNVSLDLFVDHAAYAPDREVFRQWIEHVRGASAAVYGRKIYELMRYWDEDQPGWGPDEWEFARAWRGQEKWVASRSLSTVGPGARLIKGELGTVVAELKTRLPGRITVSGPVLASSLTELRLIDLYELYLYPLVMGQGRPFFAGSVLPALTLVGHERLGAEVVRLSYRRVSG